MDGYKTIKGRCEYELVEKKSKFIAHLSHVDDEQGALDYLAEIRKEHAQAKHNVYAYVLKDGRARYSDDGEPAQTSGLPTYETIIHAGLSDVICVTTRYFGGVLLGTGGLVRAYTQACKGAISHARIVTVQSCVDVTVLVAYDAYQSAQKRCSAADAKIISTDFTDMVKIVARVPAGSAGVFSESMADATKGKCEISKSGPFDGII